MDVFLDELPPKHMLDKKIEIKTESHDNQIGSLTEKCIVCPFTSKRKREELFFVF
jgi:hypothetical protein